LSKKIVVGIVSALLLIGVFSLAFNIQPAQSEAHTITVPDDYPTIQGAVNAASSGDTIFVRNGSHGPTYVDRAVTLVGENSESTFITAQSDGYITGLTVAVDNVTITGFTITGGRNGYGMYLYNVKGVNVSGNTINTGWGQYGPAALIGDAGVSYSIFSGNSFNGGVSLSGSF
jgi:nitrous oxidase accessory protein NosD